jgi:hypothetical protein
VWISPGQTMTVSFRPASRLELSLIAQDLSVLSSYSALVPVLAALPLIVQQGPV